MKQTRIFGILVLGLLGVAAHNGACASRQGPEQYESAPATKLEVAIYVGDIAKGQHWAVVIEPQDKLSGFQVNPGYVIPLDPSGTHTSGENDGVGRLEASQYDLTDSEFHFKRLPSTKESVYVAAHVAANKLVSVYKNGDLVFHGIAASPTLIIDGTILPPTHLPLQKAICLMGLPQALEDYMKPALAANGNGVLQANTALMHQHLENLPSVAENLDEQTLDLARGLLALALVRIHVDTSGNVTLTRILSGQGPLSSAAVKALTEAKFRPFLSDGRAVEVEGVVQYSMSGKWIETSIN